MMIKDRIVWKRRGITMLLFIVIGCFILSSLSATPVTANEHHLPATFLAGSFPATGSTQILSPTPSPFPTPVLCTTPPPVPPMGAVAATAGNGKITLSWSPLPGGLLVRRSLTSGGPYTIVAELRGGSTQYIDTGLSNEHTYFYVVSVFGVFTCSDGPRRFERFSNEVAATPLPMECAGHDPAPVPTTTNLVALPGNGRVNLSWQVTSCVGTLEHVAGYLIKRSLTRGGPYTVIADIRDPTTRRYSDGGLSNGTTYYYVVSAFTTVTCNGQEIRNSDMPSNEAVVTPTALPQPCGTPAVAPRVTNLVATAGNDQVTLSWEQAPAFNAGGGFTIRRRLTSGGPSTIIHEIRDPAARQYIDSCVLSGNTYYYGVSAFATATCNGFESRNDGIPSNEAVASPISIPDFALSASHTSLTINTGTSQTNLITLTPRGGFTEDVAFSVSGLPRDAMAAFNPSTVSPASPHTTMTITAGRLPTTMPAIVTVVGTSSSGLTRTTTFSLNIIDGSEGETGGVTVTPVINANTPWFNEQAIQLSNTAEITALSITIIVQRTPGLSFHGQYHTVGSQVQQASSSNAGAVVYQFTLASGETLQPGRSPTFAAQTRGRGTLHPTSGDTYTVSYTTGGVSFTQTGHF